MSNITKITPDGKIENLSCQDMIDNCQRELDHIKRREQIVEKRKNQQMQPIIAPEPTDGEETAQVPCCPNCGNNDPRTEETGSLLTIQRFATSGWTMKCLACNTSDWIFWVSGMAGMFPPAYNQPQNARKVPLSWAKNQMSK